MPATANIDRSFKFHHLIPFFYFLSLFFFIFFFAVIFLTRHSSPDDFD